MLELTILEFFSYSATLFSSGCGVGYLFGKVITEKNIVTTFQTSCSIWNEDHTGDITVIVMNTKRSNNNCPEFSQSKNMCRLNGQKCKLMD